MGDLQDACQLAKAYSKQHFSTYVVVAWDRPVEGIFKAWAEEDWLALALSFRLKLRPHSVWNNGKRVDYAGVDRFTLCKPKRGGRK